MKSRKPAISFFYSPVPFFGMLAVIACAVFATFAIDQKQKTGEKEDDEYLRALDGFDMWTHMRSYPFEKIPAGKFSGAYEQFKLDNFVKEEAFKRAGSNTSNRENSPEGITWEPLAPKNFAGRMLSLAFHPTNQNIMWAGSASGGLWKTTNGGTGASNGINWVNVPTGFNTLGVSAIAVQNSDPNVIYIGTGEVYNVPGDYNGRNERIFRGTYGIGILKSTDGGANWSMSLNFSFSDLKGVADILIHPANPQIVFAATTDGVYRTTNGGTSWSLIHNVVMAQDICLKPGDPDVLYAGCGSFESTNHGIYKTTNATATTPGFTKLAGGLPASYSGMVRLHISAADASRVFASIGKAPGTADANGLYVSGNEGVSWGKVNVTNYINNQGWYAHDVVVSPVNTDHVFVAEMDIWRSTNGGAGITQISNWNDWDFNNTTVGDLTEGTSTSYVHADIHHLYISPFSSTTLFAVCDGGVFKSTNSGNSFAGLNGGLQTAQIYANIAQSAITNNFMILGLQDNATFVYNGSPGCRREIGGDGFSAVIDHTNDNICFGTLYYCSIYRSTDGANNFSARFNNTNDAENAAFSAPLVMARSNRNIMYAGTHRVKKSTDNGINWVNANGGASLVSVNNPIITMAVAPSDEDIVLAATAPGSGNRSRLFKSTNGGNSFTEITGVLPNRYYSDIAISAADPNRIVVTLAGYNSSHVYLTTNGGTNWVDIGQNLPDLPHNAILFDPANYQRIIVGNDLGVYCANGVTNGAVQPAWIAYNEGFIDATLVVDLVVTPNNKLRAATHGKGLWERDMPLVTLPVILHTFTTVCNNRRQTVLQWKVSGEDELSSFEVEQSNNGLQFQTIKSIPVQKNGNTVNTYNFTDAAPGSNEKRYYRLKMMQISGGIIYSDITKVTCSKVDVSVKAYPNPVKDILKVEVNAGEQDAMAELRIVNSMGQVILTQKKILSQGVNYSELDIRNVSTGVYFLTVSVKDVSRQLQIVKQ